MLRLFRVFLAFVFALCLSQLTAQRDTANSLGFAIYASFYMPGDATAYYYSGKDNNRLQQLFSNPVTRDRIEEALGGYTFQLQDYSNNMVYNSAFAFELELDYRFNNNWRILVHFVNANLEAVGDFTLLVDRRNTNNQTSDPYIERATAVGKEKRQHINLGLGKLFWLSDNFYASAEAGLDLNFVEVANNRVIIADQPFTLPTFTNQLNPQNQQITTFGSGFYLSGGLGYELGSGYGFSFKINYYNSKINVNEVAIATSNFFTAGIGFSKAW